MRQLSTLILLASFGVFPSVGHSFTVYELKSAEVRGLSQDGRMRGRTIALKVTGSQLLALSAFQAPLANGLTISVRKDKLTREYGREVWIGRVADDPFGRVVVATNPENDQDIAMEIQTGGRSYTVLETAAGYAIVENQANTVDDIVESSGSAHPRAAVTSKSSDNFIDVMLAYSDDALAQNANIETVLVARMGAVNEILSDSCASFRYRVVHIEPVVYAETGNFLTDLGCLYSWVDGCLDNLHTLRDTHGADLIQLALYQNSACGIARTNSIGSFDTVNAVSVVGTLCGADTMAHEFAHNLGIMHDRYQFGLSLSETSVPYGTGFGFVDLKNKLYTVMSYPDHCNALGITCSRTFQFSNPGFYQNGTALGITSKVDAVSQMNENFGYVAAFRTANTSYDAEVGNSCLAGSSAADIKCFVATAAMGSYMEDDVIFLRRFRDSVLLKSAWGRKFTAWYYERGPGWAFELQKREWLLAPARLAIRTVVILLRYSGYWLFGLSILILGWGFFRARRGLASLVFLIAMVGSFSRPAKALQSSQSFLSDWIGANPALRLEVPPRHQASMAYVMGSTEIGGDFNKTTVDRQQLQVTLGTYGPEAFFDASIGAIGTEKSKVEQNGLGSVEEEQKLQNYSIRTGFRTTSLGLWGLGYASESRKSDVDSAERTSISLGNKMAFGTVQLSGALRFVQEKGDTLASSKWLEEEVALGYLEGDANPRFLIEYSIARRPSILRRDGAKFTARGEAWSHQVTVEYRSAGGWIENLALYAGFDKVSALEDYVDLQEQWKVGLRAGVIVFPSAEASFGFEQNLPKNTSMPDETILTAGFSYFLL